MKRTSKNKMAEATNEKIVIKNGNANDYFYGTTSFI